LNSNRKNNKKSRTSLAPLLQNLTSNRVGVNGPVLVLIKKALRRAGQRQNKSDRRK